MTESEKIKVISVINMKGGVGKTTLVTNLAYALSYFHNKKVLLVDNDPQFNATLCFMETNAYLKYINDDKNCSMIDIYRDRQSVGPAVVQSGTRKIDTIEPSKDNVIVNIYKNQNGGVLDLIPSTLDLVLLNITTYGTEKRLSSFLNKIKGAYDIILIDCPPTIGLFTISAYIASDAYLVPIKPDHLSSIGLSLIERVFKDYDKIHNKDLKQLGFVFTMVQKNSLMEETMKAIKSSGRVCFNEILSHSVQVARAVKNRKPLFLDGASRFQGNQIKTIAKELLDKLG